LLKDYLNARTGSEVRASLSESNGAQLET